MRENKVLEQPSSQESQGYVYVLVRKDLSLEQLLVQVGHAALEAGCRLKKTQAIVSLIVCEVAGREALEAASMRLDRNNIDHHLFFEPDFEMGYSALATKSLYGDERFPMRKYPLYRANPEAYEKSANDHASHAVPYTDLKN